MDSKIVVDYTDEFEQLLKDEAERAESMGILHQMSGVLYSKYSNYINVPVILLSSAVGFLSPIKIFEDQSIFLGAMSLFISAIKTIDNYFDLTKRAEGHRQTALNYIRISKYIEIQLSLERECRMVATDLLNLITNDIQNLKDSELQIPSIVIKRFLLKYQSETTKLPAICNGLTTIKINKNILTPKPEAFIINMPPNSPVSLEMKSTAKPKWKA
jgi:hypothetical protein